MRARAKGRAKGPVEFTYRLLMASEDGQYAALGTLWGMHWRSVLVSDFTPTLHSRCEFRPGTSAAIRRALAAIRRSLRHRASRRCRALNGYAGRWSRRADSIRALSIRFCLSSIP